MFVVFPDLLCGIDEVVVMSDLVWLISKEVFTIVVYGGIFGLFFMTMVILAIFFKDVR